MSIILELRHGLEVNLPFEETFQLVSLLSNSENWHNRSSGAKHGASSQQRASIDCGVVHTCFMTARLETTGKNDITWVKFDAKMSLRALGIILLVYGSLNLLVVSFMLLGEILYFVAVALPIIFLLIGIHLYAKWEMYRLLKAVGMPVIGLQKREEDTKNSITREIKDRSMASSVEHLQDVFPMSSDEFKAAIKLYQYADQTLYTIKWWSPLLGRARQSGILAIIQGPIREASEFHDLHTVHFGILSNDTLNNSLSMTFQNRHYSNVGLYIALAVSTALPLLLVNSYLNLFVIIPLIAIGIYQSGIRYYRYRQYDKTFTQVMAKLWR